MRKLQSWLLLILTLPTENATARMRFWRALRAIGCGVLRDGVYLLPENESRAEAFRELALAISEADGTAAVVHTSSRDRAQDELFRALFDRDGQYAEWSESLSAARKTLARLPVADVNRMVRRLRREYEALRAIDYFPSEAALRAEATWTDFVGDIQTVLSPDEPRAAEGSIAPLDLNAYQGRIWATRRHLWVDRIASAWLIRRFIDPNARFVWLAKPSACPKKALGFDFDGAAFAHVGDRVTFEVLLVSFRLDKDRGLLRLGALVHALDVGGSVVPEASGFEALMTGARLRAADDDDALLDDMRPALDSLYAFYSSVAKKDTKK